MEETNLQNEVKKEKPKKTPKQKVFFGLKIAGNVIFYSVLVFLFLLSIANINAGAGKNGIPNIFGTGFLSVQTDSMDASVDALPDYYKDYKIKPFKSGDLVVCNILNDSKRQSLQVGDVITFQDSTIFKGEVVFNTHRIVYMDRDENNNITRLITEGDKQASYYGTVDVDWIETHTAAEFMNYEEQGYIQIFGTTNLGTIYAKATDIWYGGGTVADNIRNNWLLYFVLPVAVLLLVEIFFVIKNFMDYRNEKRGITKDGKVVVNQPVDMEAERERMKQELLAELRAQQMRDQSIANATIPVAPVVAADATSEETEEVTATEEVAEDNSNDLADNSEESVTEAPVVEETQVSEEAPVEEEQVETPTEEVTEVDTTPENEVLEENNETVEETDAVLEDEKEPEQEVLEETSVEEKVEENPQEETPTEEVASDDASHPAIEEDDVEEEKAEEKPKKTRSTTAKKTSTTTKKSTSTKSTSKSTTAKKTTTKKTTTKKSE